jgi:hypothetical protein
MEDGMSLDVSLSVKDGDPCPYCEGTGLRHGGRADVYDANITHNLTGMAREAGIYQHLWHPDEIGIVKASQLIEPLEAGLALLRSDPPRFEKHNAPNGWGLYKHFVPWVEAYLDACKANPDADVRACG